jgi:thiamine biosynthesis protein ThiS
MRVFVNGDDLQVADDASLGDVVMRLGLNPKVVVAQRNGDIVERVAFTTTTLADGDTIDLVQLVGGG